MCECFEGFTGLACQRARCPGDCNGHGNCATIADVAYFYGNDYDHDTASSGDGVGIIYNNWDKDSVTMCECDGGFFGADCGLRMCPKGDDPLTINQNYKKINMNLNIASGSFGGNIGFTFMGVTTYIDFDSPLDTQCKIALEANIHIGTVICDITATDSTNYDVVITFHTWPTQSRMNNLFNHDGNPALTDFYCETSQWTGASVTCAFTDVQGANIREYAYCSNRGNCDFNTGLCACNPGYGGGACSNVTNFAGTGANAKPGFQVLVDGLDYQGDALQVRSAKAKSSDFYLIEAIADRERMFFVRGDGAVGFTSLVTPGGATVSAGGLSVVRGGATVTAGGLTITDDGLRVQSDVDGASQTYVGKFEVTESGYVAPGTTALEVSTTSSSVHNLLEANNADGDTVFELDSSGRAKWYSGGVRVTGGVSVLSDGLTVSQGITVQSSGIQVNAGGITVFEGGIKAYYGVHIIGGGIQIDSGGLYVNSAGADIVTGGLRVHSGTSQLKTGVHVTGGMTMYNGGLAMTGGLTVYNNGVSVTAGGLSVEAGGIQVTAGGIDVTGGVTVEDVGLGVAGGGVDVTGGLTVQDVGIEVKGGGVDVTGGVTINDAGLGVVLGGIDVTGGLTVEDSGITVIGGGIEVNLGGIDITGGLTIEDTGIDVVSGGIAVTLGGIDVTGGITVQDTGLSVVTGGIDVTGGITVQDSGIDVTGGITVNDQGITVTTGGIDVTGGITVQDTGLTITLGGLAVDSGGIDVTGGTTVRDSGLKVIAGGFDVTGGVTVRDNGISVISGGIEVTGGLTVHGSTGFTLDSTTFTGSSNAAYSDGGSQYVLTTSDRRLKRSLEAVDARGSSLDRVNRLQGVYYRWVSDVIKDKGFDDRRHIGFIAQDVQDVIPEAVHEIDDDKHLAIDYAQVVPVLAESIKELSGSSAAIESTLRSIKEQLQQLDKRLQSLEDKEKEGERL